ncbi:uncharacterized protein LOC120335923 isoform X1 [Styela clava]
MKMEVVSTNGNEAHGILLENGGKANITEKASASIRVENLEQPPRGQTEASRNQKQAKATGITVRNGSELVMTREGNAIISVVANGDAKGIDINKGTAVITERGNARIQVGSQHHMLQYQNEVSGSQQEDTSVLQQKVYIKVRNSENT